MEDFELISRITDEISIFLDDIGVDPGDCSYDYSFDPEQSRYSAVVTIQSTEYAEVIEAFNESQDEFADHMEATFPEVSVGLVVRTMDEPCDGFGARYASLGDSDNPPDEYITTCDDEDAEDIDSQERQYFEEGLTIVDEDDDDCESILFIDDTEDGDDDEEEDSELDYLSQYDIDDNEYTPSADDVEELWRAFGGGDDD